MPRQPKKVVVAAEEVVATPQNSPVPEKKVKKCKKKNTCAGTCPEGAVCKCVKKRQPTAYGLFVKAKYDSVRDLPSKQRFAKIAEMWKAQKAQKSAE